MIIDLNAYVGHWPFRRLPARTADEVVRLMDRAGIDVAAVSSISSTLYTDPHDGNLELLEETRRHGERFVPLAVLNPKYPGWEDDLGECVELGFRGVRLYPQYHSYLLTEDECVRLVSKATELNLVISIPVRLRDGRGRHWMDAARDVGLEEVESLATKVPSSRIVLLESRRAENSGLVKLANVYFEISRAVTIVGELSRLLSLVGASRLVFGSGIPLKYALPALLKIKNLQEPEDVKEMILWRNGQVLLGLGAN